MRKFLVIPLVLMLSACATKAIKTAETPEQKAYALYKNFVIIQEEAADYVESPAATETGIRVIQEADRIAKPLADALASSVLAIEQLSADFTVLRDSLVARGNEMTLEERQALENLIAQKRLDINAAQAELLASYSEAESAIQRAIKSMTLVVSSLKGE